MQKEKLNNADRKRIRLEMQQVLVGYAAAGLVVATVVAALVLFLLMKQQPRLVLFSAVLVPVTGFVGILYFLTKDHIKDLIDGAKYTYEAHVTAKAANTNYGWHGNPAADAASQPQLNTYTLSLKELKINVREEMYDSISIGDKVWVHITPNSKLILELNKEHLEA